MVNFITHAIQGASSLGARVSSAAAGLGELSARATEVACSVSAAGLDALNRSIVAYCDPETQEIYDGEIDTEVTYPLAQEAVSELPATTLTVWEKAKLFFTKGSLGKSAAQIGKAVVSKQVGAFVGSAVYSYFHSEADQDNGNLIGRVAGCALIAIPTLYLLATQKKRHWSVMTSQVAGASLIMVATQPYFGEMGEQALTSLGRFALESVGGYVGLQLAGDPTPLLDANHLSQSHLIRNGMGWVIASTVPAAATITQSLVRDSFLQTVGYYSMPLYGNRESLLAKKDAAIQLLSTGTSSAMKLMEMVNTTSLHNMITGPISKALQGKGAALALTDGAVSALIRGFNEFVEVFGNSQSVALLHSQFRLEPTKENKEALLIALSKALKLDPIIVTALETQIGSLIELMIKLNLPRLHRMEVEMLGFPVASDTHLYYLGDMISIFIVTYLPVVITRLYDSNQLTTPAEERALKVNLIKVLFGYAGQELPASLTSAVKRIEGAVMRAADSHHQSHPNEAKPLPGKMGGVKRLFARIGVGCVRFVGSCWSMLKRIKNFFSK